MPLQVWGMAGLPSKEIFGNICWTWRKKNRMCSARPSWIPADAESLLGGADQFLAAAVSDFLNPSSSSCTFLFYVPLFHKYFSCCQLFRVHFVEFPAVLIYSWPCQQLWWFEVAVVRILTIFIRIQILLLTLTRIRILAVSMRIVQCT